MTDLPDVQRFRALEAEPDHLQRIAALAPENPFRTPAYADAHRQLGLGVWAFLLGENESIQSGTIGFIREGRVGRILTIPSTLALAADSPFWEGVETFAHRDAITEVELLSFSAHGAMPPPLRDERARIGREEYVLDLTTPDLLSTFVPAHRRSIRDAARAGLELRRTGVDGDQEAALVAHGAICNLPDTRTAGRRTSRSSAFSMLVGVSSLLAAGAAELYQAVHHGITVASLVALRAPRGAYIMSSGATIAGRACGAPYWLVYETAHALAALGVGSLDLGGTRRGEGEQRAFRVGFRPTITTMESVTLRRGRAWQWAAMAAADRVRDYFRKPSEPS